MPYSSNSSICASRENRHGRMAIRRFQAEFLSPLADTYKDCAHVRQRRNIPQPGPAGRVAWYKDQRPNGAR